MFICNVKIKPSKKAAAFFSAASIITAVVCVFCMTAVTNSAPDSATCDELGVYSLVCKGKNGGADFLKQFGLNAAYKDEKEITIPSDFNDTYNKYNNLQKRIGLNLEKYKGKSALKLEYNLKGAGAEYAVLLVYDNSVIGGHLTNGVHGQENMPLI